MRHITMMMPGRLTVHVCTVLEERHVFAELTFLTCARFFFICGINSVLEHPTLQSFSVALMTHLSIDRRRD